MPDNNEDTTHESHEHEIPSNAIFTCPNCGKVERDNVMFLCNTCEQADMIYKEGMYMCPACLAPGENFECLNCESKEVKMTLKD